MVFSLAPNTNPNLFTLADVSEGMTSIEGDIRNLALLKKDLTETQPDIVIHMAAQSLVRHSYNTPIETYETNVMGTVNLLEAIRETQSTKAVLVITSDKCYDNKEWEWGYRENEPLGGYDPYSSSKACTEIVTHAYRQSFLNTTERSVSVGTARAGNVIGGGDWAADRLIPDMMTSIQSNQPVIIRNPNAIRPWQHVLEPLSGYLTLAQKLYESPEYSEAWNFGPTDNDAKPVSWLVENISSLWPTPIQWSIDSTPQPHEAHYLKLDSSKANARLNWHPQLNIATALSWTVDWYQALGHSETDIRAFTDKQITTYQDLMQPQQELALA